MRRATALLLMLAVLGGASGCVTKKIRKVLEDDRQASLTVRGDTAVFVLVREGITHYPDVKATYETVEKGVEILRLVGAYKDLYEALMWLAQQNLLLLANDEFTRALLEAVLSALK